MALKDPIETIERCAYDAWPAEESEPLAGWRLRAMRGVSRRANSVWTFEATGDVTIEERIDRVERWYGSRNLAPTFQVAARACPAGLDAILDERGYRIDAPVSIQVAMTTDVLATSCPQDAVVTRTCSDEWFDVSARRGRFAKVADVYRALLVRIGTGTPFAVARIDGQPACVGLGVIAQGWMGVFSMLTLPSARRRGAARAVLSALASTAREEGVETMYLQVERDNAPTIALYATASFLELYGYHYRVRPGGPDAPQPYGSEPRRAMTCCNRLSKTMLAWLRCPHRPGCAGIDESRNGPFMSGEPPREKCYFLRKTAACRDTMGAPWSTGAIRLGCWYS